MSRDLITWKPKKLSKPLPQTRAQLEAQARLAEVRTKLSAARAEVLRLSEQEGEIIDTLGDLAMERECE